jgi:hypothetical protein
MSLFLLTTKNTLPEQFQASIDVSNKTGIAEKLISESFLTRENFIAALESFKTIQKLGVFRLVDGYTVTNITCLLNETAANDLRNLLIQLRQKNANELTREWTHADDPNHIVITTIPEEEWGTYQANLTADHVKVNYENLTLS